MNVSGTPASNVVSNQRSAIPDLDYSSERTDKSPSGRPRVSGAQRFGALHPRVKVLLTMLGFAVPALAYLALVLHYQVNAILADQWNDIPVIRESFMHFPDWSSLWANHNDNRIFFPNLIAIGLAHTVHFNIDVEEYISALMVFAATALFIWSHKRRSPEIPLLFYCPVAFLTLSLAGWQDALWGFQMAWYLVLFCLAATIALIDRRTLHWWVCAAAVMMAVVGSYSSLQGLLIWPVGLVLLYHRRRALWTFATWLLAAALTTVLYFHNFQGAGDDSPTHVVHQPLLALKFYMYALGDVVGVPMKAGASGNVAIMLFGVLIFLMAVIVLVAWGIQRDELSGVPVGIALIIYGLLFDALVTEGRILFGLWGATQSRYVPNDLLVLAGIFMSALGRVTHGVRASTDRRPFKPSLALQQIGRRLDRIDGRVVLWLALAAIVVQVAFSVPYGIQGAREIHQDYLTTAILTRNIDHESNAVVNFGLYLSKSATWLREQAHFLMSHHLSLFN